MVQASDPPDLTTQNGRLRWAREQKKHSSMRAAAIAHGWNENTYKSHELGIRRGGALPEDDAKKYARAFGVRIEWLMSGKGDARAAPAKPTSNSAPLLGLVGAGQPIEAIESGDPELIDVPAGYEDAIAFRVRGASCEPVFEDGDIVVTRKRDADEPAFIGQFCVVQTKAGEGYLKQVVDAAPAPGGQPGRIYTLRSPNADDLPEQNIEWARPVVLRIIKGGR